MEPNSAGHTRLSLKCQTTHSTTNTQHSNHHTWTLQEYQTSGFIHSNRTTFPNQPILGQSLSLAGFPINSFSRSIHSPVTQASRSPSPRDPHISHQVFWLICACLRCLMRAAGQTFQRFLLEIVTARAQLQLWRQLKLLTSWHKNFYCYKLRISTFWFHFGIGHFSSETALLSKTH